MTHPRQSPDIEPVYQLLSGYSFDVEAHPTDAVIGGWLELYGSVWVSHAITEALYQGRYKIISIEHILKLWQRRGQPIRHFNREFESIILGQTLLCPTGYGDSGETQTSQARVLPPLDAEPANPAPAAADRPTAPQLDDSPAPEHQPEAADSTAVDSQPESLAPPANPFNAPGSDSPSGKVIPNFRPLAPALESARPQTDEIQPFVPRQDSSELHQRLRAVVKGGMRE